MDPDSYNALLWAARPVLEDEPSETMKLPTKVEGQNMKSMYVKKPIIKGEF